MALDTRDEQMSSLEERVQQLECLLEEQRERSATQEAETARLRVAPVALMPPQLPALAALPTATGSAAGLEPEATPAPRGGTKSRRALLKLGGAAAAAGVAAVAVGATELAHPGTAHANGVLWQTGIVNADNQTVVEPSNGSFPDPALLTVRVGTGSPYNGLSAANSAAIAAYDVTGISTTVGIFATSALNIGVKANTNSGTGVYGQANGGTGILGAATNGTGVSGTSTTGAGVSGTSTSGSGVNGQSNSFYGVSGFSTSGIGVYGSTNSGTGTGVAGTSTSSYGVTGGSDSGVAVFGMSNTSTGVAGTSTSGVGVVGATTSGLAAVIGDASAGTTGDGVRGASNTHSGVWGSSTSGYGVDGTTASGIAAVHGLNAGANYGVLGECATGTGVHGQSTSGKGVVGTSTSNVGVHGKSSNTSGVLGESSTGEGVYGGTDSGFGVYGTSGSNVGVFGNSNSDCGVLGSSFSLYGGLFRGGRAPLILIPHVTAGSPNSGAHSTGELYVDTTGVFWACTAAGTPGTWMRLSGPLSGVPGGALNYLAAPIRIFDSRVGQPAPLPSVKGALAGGNTYTIQVTGTTVGGLSVPAGAMGVFGNLTVTDTQGGGDLILWPHGAPQPLASNINYSGGMTIANAANVGLSSGGAMDLYVHVSGTDVIIDIAGYVL